MPVTEKRQVQIIVNGIRGTHCRELPQKDASAKSRHHFDVTERRNVEVRVVRSEECSDLS